MGQSNAVIGLDIGSTKISAVICELVYPDELKVKGYGTVQAKGMNKGKFTNIKECSKAIEKAIEKAQKEAKIRPNKVVATIPPLETRCVKNAGILTVLDTENGISVIDKKECVRRSKNIARKENEQIVHVVPMNFRIDGVPVPNPVGLVGKQLEAESLLVLSKEETLQTLTGMLRRMSLHIAGLAYDALANGQICLTEQQRQKGVLLIDIGGEFTKASFFIEGYLENSIVIPVGGQSFTRDLSACLQIDMQEAERLKVIEGTVEIRTVNPLEEVELRLKDPEKNAVKRLLIAQILEARARELFQLIRQQMPIDRRIQEVVLTGGGSKLEGIKFIAERALNRPIFLTPLKEIEEVIADEKYQTALGLLLYGIKTKAIEFYPKEEYTLVNRVSKWVQELF